MSISDIHENELKQLCSHIPPQQTQRKLPAMLTTEVSKLMSVRT